MKLEKVDGGFAKEKVFVLSPFKRVNHSASFATTTKQIKGTSHSSRPKKSGGAILTMDSAYSRIRPIFDCSCSADNPQVSNAQALDDGTQNRFIFLGIS